MFAGLRYVRLVCARKTAPCPSTSTGDIEIVRFDSNVFSNSRFLRIWLPPGYRSADSRTRRYEVLYMNDGENLFNVCTSGNHAEWRADETMTMLVASGRHSGDHYRGYR